MFARLASTASKVVSAPLPFRALSTSAAVLDSSSHSARVLREEVVPQKIVSHPYITQNKRYLPGFSMPAPRRLEQIVKYALIEREQPAKIKEIWNEYHDSRLDAVATTWSKEEWAAIQERKRRCPRMIFPVLKGDGKFFNLIAEWQDKFCIFTFLEDYKKNPSLAEPYLSVALYDDFLDRKQLVLVRGDFSGHLRKVDAAHLLNLLSYYYFKEPRQVETFNLEPSKFDFTSFLRDMPRPPTKDEEKKDIMGATKIKRET